MQTPEPVPPVPPLPGEGGGSNFPVIVQQPYFPTPPPWVTLPAPVTLLIVLGFFAACTIVLYPLMRAFGRRLEGKGNATISPALQDELEQIRHRLNEVEAMQHRVLELEERVDFTERMIAQRREPERLERGNG
jgi:hypothetical protein